MAFPRDYLFFLLTMFHVKPSDKQMDQFEKYYELLVDKNKVMNLTAITEPKEVCLKHFADSISIIKYYDLDNVNNLIDVGTGAGFPGIPLKIMFPNLKVTLLDSLKKRVDFLNDTITELGLSQINAIHMRAEDAGRDQRLREQYDLCVSRAVANLNTLSEYCLPLVKPGGTFISYKSDKGIQESEDSKGAIHKLGGKIKQIEKFKLPDSDMDRVFIVVDKVKPCSPLYPRKAGTPYKKPLK